MPPAGHDQLWIEVSKSLLQLAVVGMGGTALKLLASYQARRQRLEAREAFRREKYAHLVGVTSHLRAVPAYIRADPSMATWTAELRSVMEADAELDERAVLTTILRARTSPTTHPIEPVAPRMQPSSHRSPTKPSCDPA